MNDFFGLLGQPRRPWLDTAAVEQAFVTAAAPLHPDRLHEAPEKVRRQAHDRYTLLNEAHRCLKNPRSRLRHLLELERGRRIQDLQEIPEDLMHLFGRLSRQLKVTDRHLEDSAKTTSALLKVALFQRNEELREELEQLLATVRERKGMLEERLRSLDHQWQSLQGGPAPAKEALLEELESIYRLISFHERWQEQIGARALRLMGPG